MHRFARPLAVCAALALPGVGPDDRRAPIDPAVAPWRAVGRVQTELGGRCTGVLVGPRTVLTAAHCLYLPIPRTLVRPGSVHFLLGYHRGSYVAHARAVAYVIGSGWDPQQRIQTLGADWATLTLDRAIGAADQILPLEDGDPASATPIIGTPVWLGGYGQDRAERIDADLHCSVTGSIVIGGRPLLRHDCGGTRGTSGAPLLARRPQGWTVLGIQVAAVAGQAAGVAVAAPGIKLPPATDR